MSARSWLREHLGFFRRRESRETIQRSRELNDAKCQLVRIGYEIERGHGPRIVHLRRNVWEEALGQGRHDDD